MKIIFFQNLGKSVNFDFQDKMIIEITENASIITANAPNSGIIVAPVIDISFARGGISFIIRVEIPSSKA